MTTRTELARRFFMQLWLLCAYIGIAGLVAFCGLGTIVFWGMMRLPHPGMYLFVFFVMMSATLLFVEGSGVVEYGRKITGKASDASRGRSKGEGDA